MHQRPTLLMLHGGPAMDSSLFKGSGLDELTDVVYEVDGRRVVRTGLPYAPYEPIETGER